MNELAIAGRLVAAALVLLLASHCDPQAIGRPCEVQADDGGAHSAAINDQAVECPSRLCVRQSRSSSVASTIDTAPFCTAECRVDDDCDKGEVRKPDNDKDLRCRLGFYCGVALVTGTSACCRKLCLCRDFAGTDTQTPTVCEDRARSGACGRTGAR